jgi:hypothetical protein
VPDVSLGLTLPFSHGRVLPSIPAVASPAAGAGFTLTVPSSYWWRGMSLAFRLVSDGSAATRQVTLTLVDEDGVTLDLITPGGTQIASLTRDYVFSINQATQNALVGTAFVAPLFQQFLRPQWALVIGITNVQTTDQVSRIRWNCDQFITGPGGYEIGYTSVEDPTLHRTQVYVDELA